MRQADLAAKLLGKARDIRSMIESGGYMMTSRMYDGATDGIRSFSILRYIGINAYMSNGLRSIL